MTDHDTYRADTKAAGEAVIKLGRALVQAAAEVQIDNTKGLDGSALLSAGFHYAINMIDETIDPTFKDRLIRQLGRV